MYLFLGFKLKRIYKLYEEFIIKIHICSFEVLRQENWQHKMVANILEILFIVPKERSP